MSNERADDDEQRAKPNSILSLPSDKALDHPSDLQPISLVACARMNGVL